MLELKNDCMTEMFSVNHGNFYKTLGENNFLITHPDSFFRLYLKNLGNHRKKGMFVKLQSQVTFLAQFANFCKIL